MLCIDDVKWVFCLEEDFSYDSGILIPQKSIFRDIDGEIRLIIDKDGTLTVKKGYAWNGCSPKLCLFDIVIGTPDGVVHRDTGKPKTYYATCIHDALYQFMQEIAPLTRTDTDRIFLELMVESKFRFAYIYWFFVRIFGRIFWRTKKKTRNWQGKREVIPDNDGKE
ncbi:MAG: DUF1353 domain-containing protein [Bacteroidales bacterium]|nr:DUF1353 domain-containing protein [Candidatus Latescibacterota bacterium]